MYKDLLYSQFAVNYLVVVLTIYTCDFNQFGCRIGPLLLDPAVDYINTDASRSITYLPTYLTYLPTHTSLSSFTMSSSLIPVVADIKSIREKLFLLDSEPIDMPIAEFEANWPYVDNI